MAIARLLGGLPLIVAGAVLCQSCAPADTNRADEARNIPAIAAVRATAILPGDPDDPAIWVNRRDPARSLIFGTLKEAAPIGGLAVFTLDGALRDIVKGADRPNNVDVEYGLDLDGTPTDIAVLTERFGRRLRVYAVAPDGSTLRDVSSGTLQILTGASADEGAPMGIGLYRRPRDGAIFAIVAPKAGPRTNYLWQYRLEDDGTGRVKATFVRRFGNFSGIGEIEAVGVDDALGVVYYADEVTGIHKWIADPDLPGAGVEQALFARQGYVQDREGIGIYVKPGGDGYVVAVDQLPSASIFHVYPRTAPAGDAGAQNRQLLAFRAPADSTDGLEVTSEALGSEFPDGVVVAMNSNARNFLIFDWRSVRRLLDER